MMKITKILLAVIFLFGFYGCEKAPRTPLNLQPSFNPCDLVNVQACRNLCEIVQNNRITAVQQEINTGINLSNFDVSICSGQFSPILRCFLSGELLNACEVLTEIVDSSDFKRVLEEPDCQCNLLYS